MPDFTWVLPALMAHLNGNGLALLIGVLVVLYLVRKFLILIVAGGALYLYFFVAHGGSLASFLPH